MNRLSLSRAVEVARTLKTSVNQLIGADGGGEVAVTTFDAQTYKLAQSLKRSSDLSPPVANRLRSLIDSICDTMETARKKKR